ncbi:unnamed protein product [Albugo candida]|uniref:Uncharacterized protein n=1 Tax=Albugo candida TaxID=65357 RepID=A0A024FUS1_9STRA|nr:unnamed protein product [Albugo candida]|eukprot:CCI10791.1 unnamed protein product [Albugo candida]
MPGARLRAVQTGGMSYLEKQNIRSSRRRQTAKRLRHNSSFSSPHYGLVFILPDRVANYVHRYWMVRDQIAVVQLHDSNKIKHFTTLFQQTIQRFPQQLFSGGLNATIGQQREREIFLDYTLADIEMKMAFVSEISVWTTTSSSQIQLFTKEHERAKSQPGKAFAGGIQCSIR